MYVYVCYLTPKITPPPPPHSSLEAMKHPFEDHSADSDRGKRRRLSSPSADRGRQTLSKDPRLRPSCHRSLSEGNSQAAAVPLESLTHKGAVPGAHISVKAGISSLMKHTADMVNKYLEPAGFSKDETKCHSKPRTKKPRTKPALKSKHEESPKVSTICYYPGQPQVYSSAPSATNCSAGSFAGPVSHIGVLTGALNTSNPHVETTATDPGALRPQGDPGFQGYLRLEQTQTGANAQLFSMLTEPATTVSTPPIGSTAPLAAHPGTAVYSSRSANIQSHSLTQNVTEETPGVPGTQGSGTGQPYYPPPPYPTNGYYATFSRPLAVYNAPHNPLLYSANGNHAAVGGPRGGQPNQSLQPSMFPQVVQLDSGLFASQLPIQRQYVLPRGLRQYSPWQSVAADTAPKTTASSYHGTGSSDSPACYSQGIGLRAGTYSNNIVIANHNLPQSTSNLHEVSGFQATTSYNFTSATPAAAAAGVMTSEGHPQGVAGFHLSNGTADGTK